MKTILNTLQEFKQTKVEMTKTQYVKTYCSDLEIMAPKVLVYNDSYYIEAFGDGYYYLTVNSQEYVRKDLEELEAILWEGIKPFDTENSKLVWADRADAAISNGMDAFWDCIASSFPEAKSGDLSFTHDIDFRSACGIVVRQWIKQNCNISL